jgi:hypothetical protein
MTKLLVPELVFGEKGPVLSEFSTRYAVEVEGVGFITSKQDKDGETVFSHDIMSAQLFKSLAYAHQRGQAELGAYRIAKVTSVTKSHAQLSQWTSVAEQWAAAKKAEGPREVITLEALTN